MVMILNRSVLWLRKLAIVGFMSNTKTRQCIFNNNEFHKCCSFRLHDFVLIAFQKVFFLSSSCHHSPLSPCRVFFFLHDCWHLRSSVFMWEKKTSSFFPHVLCCLWLIFPRPVSCVFSPISGILTSPPSMWVTHMCDAGVSCRAGSRSLCELGLLCVCVCVLVDLDLCACVFICNPLGRNFHEGS